MTLTANMPQQEVQTLAGGRSIARPRRRNALLVALFLLSLPFPFYFNIGSVTIFPYRLLLLVALLPCGLMWLSGKAGRIQSPDILIVCFVIWAAITFAIAQGMVEAIEPSGALLLETFGAYLLARVYIRDLASFQAMTRLLFVVVLALIPFALLESVTGRNVLLDLFRPITSVYVDYLGENRWGLHRAQASFPHPILYGVFCSATLSLTFYVVMMKRAMLVRLLGAGLVSLATFFSLSTGAFVSLVMQILLAGWDLVTRKVRRRWQILAGLAASAFIAVSLLSTRTPFHVFISYLTFNLEASYNRILIWDYGTAEVMRHPLFGIGFHEWERAWWMSTSMDNFWLVIAVRHGLPGFFFLTTAIVLIMYKLGKAKMDADEVAACRTGLLISLGGLILSGITVHFWTQLYAFFMFLLGSGVWMIGRKHAKIIVPPAPRDDLRSASTPSLLGRRVIK